MEGSYGTRIYSINPEYGLVSYSTNVARYSVDGSFRGPYQ